MNIHTVKDVAAILKVKEKTLYQWCEQGQIPCLKLNGCLRFDLDDIQAWIKGCKKEASGAYNILAQARSPRKGGQR